MSELNINMRVAAFGQSKIQHKSQIKKSASYVNVLNNDAVKINSVIPQEIKQEFTKENLKKLYQIIADTQSKVLIERANSAFRQYTLGYQKGETTVLDLYSANLELLSRTITKTDYINKSKFVLKSQDYRTNTILKTTFENNNVVSETRIVKSNDAKPPTIEFLTKSDIEGIYNITRLNPDKTLTTISKGTIDQKTGVKNIEQHLTSPAGTRTDYYAVHNPDGSGEIKYKITDPDGKILMDMNQKHIKESENEYTSVLNGIKKTIIHSNDGIVTGDSIITGTLPETLKFENYLDGDIPMLKQLLKQLSAQQLTALKHNTASLNGVKTRSCYYRTCHCIHTQNSLYALLHELGHAITMDTRDMLLNGERKLKKGVLSLKLKGIYKKEKNNFNKKYGLTERTYIDYFTGQYQDGENFTNMLTETIAETNALLNGAIPYEDLAVRSHYLKQNFPETIAYLSDILLK